MKRLHLHVSVTDLDRSIGFYSTLFGTEPSVVKDDYAKWMLEDPRVNFAISARGLAGGVDHVGVQADSPEELQEIAARLKSAGETTFDQEATTCCYAQSDKAWVTDPSGVRWETFYTFADAPTYGEGLEAAGLTASGAPAPGGQAACCGAPQAKPASTCC